MKKTFILLIVIFVILLLLLLFWFLFFRGLRQPSGLVEINNSYLFASPLQAKVAVKEKIRVTVFILDEQGRGVIDEPVFLGQDDRLEISSVQAVTDDFGRAIFDVSTNTSGEYYIEAKVKNKVLPQRVRVSFR
ncbi:MAG TPA: hypothetical protein VMX76_04080 [Nevskiaceae bacterium]|nr:hypothetical protein [Nevskiaceae bacterium]